MACMAFGDYREKWTLSQHKRSVSWSYCFIISVWISPSWLCHIQSSSTWASRANCPCLLGKYSLRKGKTFRFLLTVLENIFKRIYLLGLTSCWLSRLFASRWSGVLQVLRVLGICWLFLLAGMLCAFKSCHISFWRTSSFTGDTDYCILSGYTNMCIVFIMSVCSLPLTPILDTYILQCDCVATWVEGALVLLMYSCYLETSSSRLCDLAANECLRWHLMASMCSWNFI